MGLKIYLAARYSRRAEMEKCAEKLKAAGYEITSEWVYGGEEGLSESDIALMDLRHVSDADMVLSFTEGRGVYVRGGGRHVEMGYGLALGKNIVVIGKPENVFHNHPSVTCLPDLETFMWWIKQYGNSART